MFEGKEIKNMNKALRSEFKTEFSSNVQHNRDVQIVFDENYLNYLFFSLFYRDNPISMFQLIN